MLSPQPRGSWKEKECQPREHPAVRQGNIPHPSNGHCTMAPSILSYLDDDALREVLIRTRAADHEALRATCRRFRDVMGTFAFRQERGESGFAEVECTLECPFEQYKRSQPEDFSSDEEDDEFYYPRSRQDPRFLRNYNRFGRSGPNGETPSLYPIVYVDGLNVPMRAFEISLWPRHPHVAPLFLEMCGSKSNTLEFLTDVCFDTDGKPIVKSIHFALDGDRRSLLYVDKFHLPREYQTCKSTVGPAILKFLLNVVLKDCWAVTLYIPFAPAQMCEADVKEHERIWEATGESNRCSKGNDIKLREGWDKFCARQTEHDMRQMFRAGFRQLTDPLVMEVSASYVMFGFPSECLQSIRSEEDVLKIKILDKAPPRRQLTPEEKELTLLVATHTETRDSCLRSLESYGNPLDPISIAYLESIKSSLNKRIIEAGQAKRSKAKRVAQKASEAIDRILADVKHAVRRSPNEAVHQMKAQIDEMDLHLKEELKCMVIEAGRPNIIFESDAIHSCAFYWNITSLSILLDMLPKSLRKKAINSFNTHGRTPLMLAARTVDEIDELNQRKEACRFLLTHGADKSIKTKFGLTALGCFRMDRQYQGNEELSDDEQEADRALERLLTPNEGPSSADDAIYCTRTMVGQ